ncbi:UNVERIFIED_CONTAM: hypothetical protein PYX00_006539 [Menopon gallinae]|uniref:Uncharacterized protein n=1 Tax=Menopon gallinae TaxID=328185 RepID=A0AAW2HW35_9NEOP
MHSISKAFLQFQHAFQHKISYTGRESIENLGDVSGQQQERQQVSEDDRKRSATATFNARFKNNEKT